MPLENPPASPLDNTIEIIESFDEWFVRVVENGIDHVAVFVAEAFAAAFAEGQRVRLGLTHVTRL